MAEMKNSSVVVCCLSISDARGETISILIIIHGVGLQPVKLRLRQRWRGRMSRLIDRTPLGGWSYAAISGVYTREGRLIEAIWSQCVLATHYTE